MAFQLTLTAKALANQISISPNLIVEIEGVDLIFGISPILEAARWDNNLNWDQEGVRWDGLVEKSESRAYLSFKKSTNTISQQIMVDKGGSSSVSTMNVQIINKNTEISQAISFDKITEILGKKANVYLNFAGGSHPEDSVPIFRGFIDDYSDDNTSIILSISHSENLKRQSFLEQYNSNLTAKFRYKELTVQDIFYEQRNKAQAQMTVQYIAGGALSAVLNGNDITVTVAPTSTADLVIKALRENTEINAVVTTEIIGNGATIQIAVAQTSFTIDTVVNVESTNEFIASGDALTSYLKIGDEFVEVVSVDSLTQFTVIRSELGSFPDSHANDDDIQSVYRLQGNPFDLALKIMLSEEGNEFYDSSQVVESFRYVNDSTDLPNGIIFSNLDIEDVTGLVAGDTIRIALSDNNDGDYIIDFFDKLEDGRSVIFVKGDALVIETTSTPSFSFLSKYAVLPSGLGMLPAEVDVAGFEAEQNLYSPNFTDHDFKIDNTIDSVKDFIDKEIFFPQGLYSIPRKARVSVKYTSPPLSIDDTPHLDINNIVEIQNLRQKRSTHKYFYNHVVVKFNKSIFDSKFKSSIVTLDEDSFNRVKVGRTPFKIEAQGLPRSTATDLMVTRLSGRLLDRYKFGARFFENVHVLYKTGYNLEIGDVISFGGENTKLINLQTGNRDFPISLYEIVNKSIAVENGRILLSLLETGFGLDGRFAVISPASTVGSGSTTTRLRLNKFLDIGEYDFEGGKWANWIGGKIIVRTEDYSQCETVTIEDIPLDDLNSIIISELGFAPVEDMIIELADYDEQPINDIGDSIKLKYAFLMEQQSVTAQISNISFEANIGGLVPGQGILIHNDDYTNDSIEVKIDTIVGNIITLSEALAFSPDVNYRIETLDFASDSGAGYRYL